jgi:hypothetical protein
MDTLVRFPNVALIHISHLIPGAPNGRDPTAADRGSPLLRNLRAGLRTLVPQRQPFSRLTLEFGDLYLLLMGVKQRHTRSGNTDCFKVKMRSDIWETSIADEHLRKVDVTLPPRQYIGGETKSHKLHGDDYICRPAQKLSSVRLKQFPAFQTRNSQKC